MGYGSRKDHKGNELRASGSTPIITGEKVPGNIVQSLEFATSEDGEVNEKQAILSIKQTNGAVLNHRLFDSDSEKAQDITNRQMLHIFSQVMSEDQFFAAVGSSENFQDYIKNLQSLIPKIKNQPLTMKIIYSYNKNSDRYYAGLPAIPNFAEPDGTEPSTLSTNPNYDYYSIPKSDEPSEEESGDAPKVEAEDVEF